MLYMMTKIVAVSWYVNIIIIIPRGLSKYKEIKLHMNIAKMHVFFCHQNVYKNFNMGFISPHGLHIPIVTITKNNILLVKDIYVILVTDLQGLDFIDMVLLSWWILWFTGWT